MLTAAILPEWARNQSGRATLRTARPQSSSNHTTALALRIVTKCSPHPLKNKTRQPVVQQACGVPSALFHHMQGRQLCSMGQTSISSCSLKVTLARCFGASNCCNFKQRLAVDGRTTSSSYLSKILLVGGTGNWLSELLSSSKDRKPIYRISYGQVARLGFQDGASRFQKCDTATFLAITCAAVKCCGHASYREGCTMAAFEGLMTND